MIGARKSFHIPGSRRHLAPDREFHAEHITIRLKVDLEFKTIAGSCSTTLTPLRAGTETLHFDAREMRVEAVKLDGSTAAFEYDGDVISVKPGRALSLNQHEVTVEYRAKPRQGVYFVGPDPDSPAKPAQAWTQSEAEAARYWYPCHDHPNDKATSESFITVRDGFLAVSNGRLVASETRDGWTTYHWQESAPHSTYLNSFVVGRFGEIRQEADGVRLEYLFPEEKRKDALRYFGLTPDMMKTFVQMTGVKYPYERYAQVAVHDFIYGGMENISATTLTDTRFPDERSEEDYAARYSRPDRTQHELVAHELAHMWFGDLVTTKHWPHTWLNEGFATYFEALYHERRFGVDELRQNMLAKAETYFEEDESRYRRAIVDDVYVYADDLFDAFTYEKASWMIHQLRYVLGDDMFFRGTSEFLKRFSYKNADTHDYEATLEEVSGLSLEGYFDQFFFKAGHPEFEVECAWDASSSTAELSVRQVQHVDDLTPVFQLPCDVVFYTHRGRQARRVMLRSQDERFHFELDSAPSIVEFDPEERLLKKVVFKKSLALLTNQLEGSVDSSSRARAAEAMSAHKGDDSVEALRKAAMTEQYWSVRSRAAESLGKIGTGAALEALLQLTTVGQRRVRRSVIAALGEFKGEARAQEAITRALLGDESPYVQCEAAISLAKTRADDAEKLIKEAMELPSPEHALTEAGLEALGYLKKNEVRPTLREHLRYGNPTRARVGALKGFVRLGWLGEEDAEMLKEIVLKDKEYPVRDQVLETVAELGDRRFLETVRAVSEEDVDPRVRRRAMEVHRDLSALTETPAVSALRDDVERMKHENRELRERLTSMKLT